MNTLLLKIKIPFLTIYCKYVSNKRSKLDCYLNKKSVNNAKLSDFVNMNPK